MTDYSQMPLDILLDCIEDHERELGYMYQAGRHHLKAHHRAAMRFVLDVPYYSQWGRGANERNGDCGPAALACIVEKATGCLVTVNEVAAACGQPRQGPGSQYTTSAQLIRGAEFYGLAMYRAAFDLGALKNEIEQGDPFIALINYGVLAQRLTNAPDWIIRNQDSFTGWHWVCVVGYSVDYDCVVINDSDYYQPRTNDGDHRRVLTAAFVAAWQAASYISVALE